jgi:hypothetical protein
MPLIVNLNDYRISKAIGEAAERVKKRINDDIQSVTSANPDNLSSKELLRMSREQNVSLSDIITRQRNNKG